MDLAEASGLKQAIAQAIVDRIIERTGDGQGLSFSSDGSARSVNLKSPYSKMYTESLEFKAAGKKKNDVNMKLTGDMLASVDVLSISGNKIRIGIADDNEKLKAFNHLTGDTVPRRPWFGISKKEMEAIKSEFDGDIKSVIQSGERLSPTQEKALDVLKAMASNGDEEL